MSGPRSEVKRPMAAPDGTFPLLEKMVSRSTLSLGHIDRMYFEFLAWPINTDYKERIVRLKVKKDYQS